MTTLPDIKQLSSVAGGLGAEAQALGGTEAQGSGPGADEAQASGGDEAQASVHLPLISLQQQQPANNPDGNASPPQRGHKKGLLGFRKEKFQQAITAVKVLNTLDHEVKKTWRSAVAAGGKENWNLPSDLWYLRDFEVKQGTVSKEDLEWGIEPPKITRENWSGAHKQDWVKTKIGIHGATIVVLWDWNPEQLSRVCDCRKITLINVREALKVDAPSGLFPFRLSMQEEGVPTNEIVFATESRQGRNMWTSAVQKLSGAHIINEKGVSVSAKTTTQIGLLEGNRSARATHKVGMLENYMIHNYTDTSKWTGDVTNGLWQGLGMLQHEIGDEHDGSYMNGEKHGKGILVYACGDIYEGDFIDGKRHGFGILYHGTNDPITKMVKQHTLEQRMEFGRFFPLAYKTFKDRRKKMDRYKGEWRNDYMHGFGIATENANANPEKYRVEYVKGVLKSKVNLKDLEKENAPRHLSYTQEEMVIGAGDDFAPNPVRHIEGRPPFTFSVKPDLPKGMNFNTMTGEITGTAPEDKQSRTPYQILARNDYGTTTAVIGIVVLVQPWQSGIHTQHYEDGSVYHGEWLFGLWHGHGQLVLASGEVYSGNWIRGLKHGLGKLETPYGTVYEGEWEDDLKHGWGKMLYLTGERYEGEWEKGLRQGNGTFYNLDSSEVHGIWADDKLLEASERTFKRIKVLSFSEIYKRVEDDWRTFTGEGIRFQSGLDFMPVPVPEPVLPGEPKKKDSVSPKHISSPNTGSPRSPLRSFRSRRQSVESSTLEGPKSPGRSRAFQRKSLDSALTQEGAADATDLIVSQQKGLEPVPLAEEKPKKKFSAWAKLQSMMDADPAEKSAEKSGTQEEEKKGLSLKNLLRSEKMKKLMRQNSEATDTTEEAPSSPGKKTLKREMSNFLPFEQDLSSLGPASPGLKGMKGKIDETTSADSQGGSGLSKLLKSNKMKELIRKNKETKLSEEEPASKTPTLGKLLQSNKMKELILKQKRKSSDDSVSPVRSPLGRSGSKEDDGKKPTLGNVLRSSKMKELIEKNKKQKEEEGTKPKLGNILRSNKMKQLIEKNNRQNEEEARPITKLGNVLKSNKMKEMIQESANKSKDSSSKPKASLGGLIKSDQMQQLMKQRKASGASPEPQAKAGLGGLIKSDKMQELIKQRKASKSPEPKAPDSEKQATPANRAQPPNAARKVKASVRASKILQSLVND